MTQSSLQVLAPSAVIGGIDSYISYMNQIPILSLEEEQQLANNFRETGDLESAKRLVLAHIRYVIRVARGYLGYGLPLGDLIQEGSIGLMKAVKRFDPALGVRLVSFAVHWIKAEMHEYILRNWRIVRVATTKAQRKLFFKLRQQKKRLGWFTDEEIGAVAKDLGVGREDVMLMEQRLNAVDIGFDAPQDSSDESTWVPAEYLADPQADPAYLLAHERGETRGREQLQAAWAQLDARSQDILSQRWLTDTKATLHELAAKYAVSAERVRQLEKQALTRLEKIIKTLDN